MRKIWKYALTFTDEIQAVVMPAGSEVVFVAMQHSIPTLWALVDDENPTGYRQFTLFRTGEPAGNFDNDLSYVGTAMNDELVCHVFEVKP